MGQDEPIADFQPSLRPELERDGTGRIAVIVDVHTHCIQPEHVGEEAHRENERAGYPPMRPLVPEAYDRDMEAVDAAIVFGVTQPLVGVHVPNEYVAEWVRRDPSKYIGFMALDPLSPESIPQMQRCNEDLGLRGIKLYPVLHPFDPADPAIFPFYEAAQRLRLPILFHMGATPDRRGVIEWSKPLVIDVVARAFPDLKIVIAHLGHPWQQDAAIVLRKHANVYGDVSGLWVRPWQGFQALLTCIEWGVAHKLLFGSDYPFWTPREGMDKMRRLNEPVTGTALPRVPEEIVEAIIHRDSLALLGLDR